MADEKMAIHQRHFIMLNSPYAYQHYLLRSVSAQLHQMEIAQVALQPGVQSVYRVTCHYPHANLANSVATLVSSRTGAPTLTVTKDMPGTRVETYTFDPTRFHMLTSAFSTVRFDKLEDQPDIPAQGVTLWLVERAAGSFRKSVLLSPELAGGVHQDLIYRLHEVLPQAVEPSGMAP